MANCFGSSFAKQYGDTINPVWRSEIEKLTREQLWNGIQVMQNLGQDFPPSLPAFIAYCTKGKPKQKADMVVRPNFDQGKYIPPGYNKPALSGHVMTAEEARAKAKEIVGIKK